MIENHNKSGGETLAEAATIASFIFLIGMSLMSILMFILYLIVSPAGWGISVAGGH